ncbi:MAG: hypothetical protein ACN6NT_08290, partial [Comamonas sp.]
FDDLLMLYNVAKTTPPASRGQLPGRTRTAPTEAPLPEFVLEHPALTPNTPPSPQTLHATAITSEPPPMANANLDLLSAALAQSPLTLPTPHSDTSSQPTKHFVTNEALFDGLSLDWETTPPASPNLNIESEKNQIFDDSDAELQLFIMDERDLPKDPRSEKIN